MPGKTSLIKCLTGAERLQPKDQLFATLDVTVHPGRLERSGIEIFLVDTVGFVSDVPTRLISSFTATLQDVMLAVR
jgi:50S ribosomal subunit-associated GTPase HflX